MIRTLFKLRNIQKLLIFLISFLLDRVTKMLAFSFLTATPLPVCYGLNFVLSWNRGVTWSLFSTQSTTGFWLLNAIIGLVIVGFGVYAYQRAQQNKSIFWELLVLGGAVSNMVDRFVWGAVLDFIEVYVATFSWPIFNGADAFVVIGICGIFVRTWRFPHD